MMTRSQVRKGQRVIFTGPQDVIEPLFDAASHKLMGRAGTIVYGISEDILCYPDDPASDLVWVAFEDDRLPRRQVSAAWLEPVIPG